MSTDDINHVFEELMKLVIFNKEKKIQFYGNSTVQFNAVQKNLTLSAESEIKELHNITVTLDKICIQKENFLCIIDDKTNKDLVIIFPSKEKCNIVMDDVRKTQGSSVSESMMERYLFKNNIYIPILKESALSKNDELKLSVIRLINQFGSKDREEYMKVMFDTLASLHDDTPATTAAMNDQIRKRRATEENDEEEDGEEEEENVRFRTRTKRRRLSYDPPKTPKRLIMDTTHYELCEIPFRGNLSKRLFIFTSAERKECYEFYYHPANDKYECKRCRYLKHGCSVKFFTDEEGNTKLEYVKRAHICEPTEYNRHSDSKLSSSVSHSNPLADTSNYEIVEFPSRGTMSKRLYIFTNPGRSHCFEFYHNKTEDRYICKMCRKKNVNTSVKFYEDSDGKEELRYGNNFHACSPVPYDASKVKGKGGVFEDDNDQNMDYSNSSTIPCIEPDETSSFLTETKPQIVLRQKLSVPAYELVTAAHSSSQRILIFTSQQKTHCYEFLHNNFKGSWMCRNCFYLKHSFIVKMEVDENGKVQFYKNNSQIDHMCEPMQYEPDRYLKDVKSTASPKDEMDSSGAHEI